MLVINQLRDPNAAKGCTEKMACKLGNMVRSSSPISSLLVSKEKAADWMIDVAAIVLPKQSMLKFSRSFRSAIDETDKSSCDQECLRCIKI